MTTKLWNQIYELYLIVNKLIKITRMYDVSVMKPYIVQANNSANKLV